MIARYKLIIKRNKQTEIARLDIMHFIICLLTLNPVMQLFH